MLALNTLKKSVIVWLLVTLFAISNSQSQSTPIPCPSSQLLCGGNICYDPTTQYCTEFGTVVQCNDVCGNQCYNSTTQECFNGTICPLGQQLCLVKYDRMFGFEYGPSPQCYNSTYEACLNHTLCDRSTEACNGQCLPYDQVCVNNVTVCDVPGFSYKYQPNQIQLCNNVCYDSAIQKCTNGTIQCIDVCQNQCYNSTTQECFNGTVCPLGQQLCLIKYDSGNRREYNPPWSWCYNPTYIACFNNSVCDRSRTCNQQCLAYNQVCVNNMTVCNVTGYSYSNYQPNQI